MTNQVTLNYSDIACTFLMCNSYFNDNVKHSLYTKPKYDFVGYLENLCSQYDLDKEFKEYKKLYKKKEWLTTDQIINNMMEDENIGCCITPSESYEYNSLIEENYIGKRKVFSLYIYINGKFKQYKLGHIIAEKFPKKIDNTNYFFPEMGGKLEFIPNRILKGHLEFFEGSDEILNKINNFKNINDMITYIKEIAYEVYA